MHRIGISCLLWRLTCSSDNWWAMYLWLLSDNISWWIWLASPWRRCMAASASMWSETTTTTDLWRHSKWYIRTVANMNNCMVYNFSSSRYNHKLYILKLWHQSIQNLQWELNVLSGKSTVRNHEIPISGILHIHQLTWM